MTATVATENQGCAASSAWRSRLGSSRRVASRAASTERRAPSGRNSAQNMMTARSWSPPCMTRGLRLSSEASSTNETTLASFVR